MLTELHIENIAVIERADIELCPGLNILTGETGAGKSIVIDSLDAVLGGRVSRELVRAGAEKASVTAVFSAESAAEWFEENDVERDDTLVLRRRISADGRGGASVNGTPVSAAQLRSLGALLLDIHGQNDGRQLMDESRHREYLDSFARLAPELERYGGLYASWKEARRALRALDMDDEEKRRLEESLRYRIAELSGAELKAGEEAELSARRDILRNAEKLTEAVEGAYQALYGADGSAAEKTGDAAAFTRRASQWAPELAATAKQIDEASALLADAGERLRDFLDSLDFSPEEYDALETRLALLRRYEKKYSCDEAGLIDLLAQSEKRLEEIGDSEELRRRLTVELAARTKETMAAARAISQKRAEAALLLQKRVEEGLRELNMPSVRFKTELTPVAGEPGFGQTGCDEVRFLMSANAGEEPGRISRIASGGELARIMLVMKDVLSENDAVGTMVFDEIDEGVSGVAAQRVGEKLCRLSRRKQVICVTHLPQIAAMADEQLLIKKTERAGRTYTQVTPLDSEGRIEEIARLHGGANITPTTLASAKEQLAAAESYRKEVK